MKKKMKMNVVNLMEIVGDDDWTLEGNRQNC